MTTEFLITTCAVIVGPVLAVQAQKWIEMFREKRGRKHWVFQTLMATRAARTSMEHVQALNMIDLVFYGKGQRRSTKEQEVINCWKEYHDHLQTPSGDNDRLWFSRCDELFFQLLYAMAEDVGYSFDRVLLRKGAYSPQAHGILENENQASRRLLLELLAGNRAIKMEVVNVTPAPQTAGTVQDSKQLTAP